MKGTDQFPRCASRMMLALRGPWRLNPRTGQVHTAPASGRPHGAVVASVGHHSGFAEMDVIGPLVAAAPELLSELIDLRGRFHNACRAAGSDEEFVSGSTPGADSAIAKAKGSAS